jgi:alpha-N-arabinofuranosidase
VRRRPTGEVESVVAAATHDEVSGELVLFVANRSPDLAVPLELELAGSLAGHTAVRHRVLQDADPGATNTARRPDAVLPRDVPVTGQIRLEPDSWNVLRCAPRPA